MEDVFWIDRDFKAQLCVWAPSCPINLTYNSDIQVQAWLETPNTSSISGKVVFTITPLESLVTMHIIFDKNAGGKSECLLQF